MIQADLNQFCRKSCISVCAMLALVGAVYTSKDALARVLLTYGSGVCSCAAVDRLTGARANSCLWRDVLKTMLCAVCQSDDLAVCRCVSGDGAGLS